MNESSNTHESTGANDGFYFVNPELKQSQPEEPAHENENASKNFSFENSQGQPEKIMNTSANDSFDFASLELREAESRTQIQTDTQENIDINIVAEDESFKFRFTSDMLRLTLYRCISRCVTALTLVLLWKKFWSGVRPFSDGCAVAAVCLFALAWFAYLRMDGMKFRHVMEERRRKRPRATLDLTDYADQHIVTEEELSPNERAACSLIASLIAGIIFLIPVIVAMI